MTQSKKYAIRCSSEEEARECNENGHVSIICVGDSAREVYLYTHKIDNARIEGYTIISYKEAVEMGLLEDCDKCKGTGIISTDDGTSYHCKCEKGQEMEKKFIETYHPQTTTTYATVPNQKELNDRDNDLANIFNTSLATETKGDLYMRIIEYLVKKGFLQDEYRKVLPNKVFGRSENVIANIMDDINLYAFSIDRMIGTDVQKIREILTKYLSSK